MLHAKAAEVILPIQSRKRLRDIDSDCVQPISLMGDVFRRELFSTLGVGIPWVHTGAHVLEKLLRKHRNAKSLHLIPPELKGYAISPCPNISDSAKSVLV
jgi:hypothetical protein